MSERTSFVRLLVGFLLTATAVVRASCPIELSPPSVVLKYGDSVSINCSTSESEFRGMGWEATEGGTGLMRANHLIWTVQSLKDWEVSPSCFINPTAQSQFKQCSTYPKVVLYTFPENISIGANSISGREMRENDEYNFTCHINNIAPVQNLTVTWYKGDTIIHKDTFENPSKEPVDQSSVFSFTPSREDDGVTFRCEAHLDLRPEGPQFNVSSEEYNITVQYGPDVKCSSPEIPEGETLEKHCPVVGYPTPDVKWWKDGKLIDPAVPLSRGDAGPYTVEAEGSSYYKKEHTFFITYGPELFCPGTYSALEFAPNNLTCIVRGYPEPDIIWYKDGEEVELPQNLTRSDTGQYTITASTSLSSVNHTVEFDIQYPPSPIVELEDSEVDFGSTVWLKCSSSGNPRPQYSWKYYQAANVKEDNEDGVSRLIIHNATAYNMGSYTCHAWNKIGNVSKTVRVTVKGANQECPVKIVPDRMVIQYRGSAQTAKCEPTSPDNLEEEIYWEDLQGTKTESAIWSADPNKDWNPRPACIGTFQGLGRCQKHLNFTLYKLPDSISIRRVDNMSSVVEDREFQLQCDIINVAPAKNLIVKWYRGNETFEPTNNGSLQVTGCFPKSNTNCDVSAIRSPLNVSSTISVTLNRTHSGAEFSCGAQLDLELEGQPPIPSLESSPVSITVYYKPTINVTKLPKTIPLFSGYPEDLVCEADGHPPPSIKWSYSTDLKTQESGQNLTVYEAGIYRCNASNDIDSISHEVVVILKEDYLPLIAGFVAVTVVAISVVFLFIYSIYYKNTKMRRYSLKNPKLSTHNGNVAHNGWDMQFPMTKLS